MTSEILIRNGRLADGTGRDMLGDILLKNGRIAAIDSCGAFNVPAGCREFDAENMLVIPGAIDTHAHYLQERIEGYNMLIAAGTTTALDACISMPDVQPAIQRNPVGLNALFCYCLWPGRNISPEPSSGELEKAIQIGLDKGAFGVKIIGGHVPFSPEATARAIAAADKLGVPIVIHAGTTRNCDNLAGMLELCELTAGHPLHMAHIDCYCNGTTLDNDLYAECSAALKVLQKYPAIVSESNLSGMAFVGAGLDEAGRPSSRYLVNAVTSLGYAPCRSGIEKAIADRKIAVSCPVNGIFQPMFGETALAYFRQAPSGGTLGLPKNKEAVSAVLAAAKNTEKKFIINALSTDGGIVPRNVLLDRGLALVDAGVLQLNDFLQKIGTAPAAMLGLEKRKGALQIDMDADILIVDPASRQCRTVIAGGNVVLDNGEFFAAPNQLHSLEGAQKLYPYWVSRRP